MRDHALAPAAVGCARCGYLADASGGAINFCPKCGADLRGRSVAADAGAPRPTPVTLHFEASPPPEAAQGRDDERTFTSAWIGQGQVIAERYRLIELLGEGGMGAVFKAEHVRMGKALAVKLLRGTFARDPSAVARFRAEAQIVSRLSHPHTIAVFDFGEIGEEGFYLAMEYVPGKNLAVLLGEHGAVSPERAAGIAEQILGSLAEAHEAGVVHRDVKPANVVVVEAREGDFVKVLDFGIAKLRDPIGVDTTADAVLGTPSYLAPEQARGVEVDGRADLYSVGALLYEMLAGRPPFVAAGPLEVVAAHLREAPTPLRELAPGVSVALEEVVHRALAKLPGERFEDAHAMREALLAAVGRPGLRPGATGRAERAAVRGELVPSGPPSMELARRADFDELARERRVMGRNRTAALALGAAALLLGSGLVTAWRWSDVYPVLARRLPRVAASLAPSLRPTGFFDGEEHEPNDSPAHANALLLPDRQGETAAVRGRVGARLDAGTGDVDVFLVAVPPSGRRQVLVAEWSAEARPGEGIRGLDVKLTLNRDHGGGDRRRSAPLVTQVDRGGPGRPERLAALVAPGTYYLAVRETHPEASAPVERPADAYQLRVRLEEPRPGEELEPNDEPEPAAGALRYAQWRSLAERNLLGEGDGMSGETSEDDPDTFAVASHGPAARLELVLLVPEPGLALSAQLWLPDAEDVAGRGAGERVRFAEAGEGEPGEALAVKIPQPSAAGAPTLLRLRAASGDGRYDVLALGAGRGGARALLAMLAAGGPGGPAGALEAAAAFARVLPAAAARDEVLLAAGRLAENVAPRLGPDALAGLGRAARSLGRSPFEVAGGKVRYGGAFEVLANGAGPAAEEARLRTVSLALPCTAEEVAERARAFLARFPRSGRAREVRLALARAEEDAFFETGERAALRRALEAYRAIASSQGRQGEEARDRVRALSRRRPEQPAVPRTRCE